jgi:hypothetical protein
MKVDKVVQKSYQASNQTNSHEGKTKHNYNEGVTHTVATIEICLTVA